MSKTPTGRTPTSPNMQGIPTHTPEGKTIKRALARTWGDVFRAHLRRGEDHGSAAYAADEWEKRK